MAAKNKKVVFIVVDGMADTPQDGKTPLSAAKKPNMDWFAAHGACGELDLISKQMWKTIDQKGVSQYANVNLLGYGAGRYPLDRGPLEAVGAGIPYEEGHLALRCNFATVDKDMRILDRRAGRDAYGLDDIARYINEHVKIGADYVFKRTYGHRAVLIIKKQLSAKIAGNDVDAGEEVKRVEALGPDAVAEESAKLVQEFIDKAHGVMQFHPKNAERIGRKLPPANYVIVRQAGNKLFALPNFARQRKLKGAVCIAENGVMKATCMLAGFNSITVPELPPSETLDFIFENIDAALTEYDFVYAHIKHADEAAHDGDFKGKQRIVEDIDRRLEQFRNFEGILVLTCDHITSCERKSHMHGNVPVLVYGRGKEKYKSKIKKFDEFSAKRGNLGVMKGRQLLKFIFSK